MKRNIGLALILMLLIALSRWPGLMPQNFSAIYAVAFCAGLYLPARLAWAVPLGSMFLADCLITFFFYQTSASEFSLREYLVSMLPNYFAYAGIIWLGRRLGAGKSWWLLTSGGLIGAFLFYLITNTAAWLSLSYSKTLLGWIQALTTGLPGFPPTWEFFRNTLLSGGLFTGLFVGAMKMTEPAESAEEKKEPSPAPEPKDEPEEAKA